MPQETAPTSQAPADKAARPPVVPPGILLPFALITSCFAAWGIANNMTDTLLSAFKRILSLTDFQTSWVQIAFYGAYFCLALPAALFIRRFSYKAGVLLGLGLFIAGGLLFYPASMTMQYWHFLAALYVLASGCAILETSANPYILTMGADATATQRLNLAQSFNPLGSLTGVILSQLFILSQLQQSSAEERAAMAPDALREVQMAELQGVMGPYVVVSLCLLLIWAAIFFVRMPHPSGEGHDPRKTPLAESARRLLRNKAYVAGVVALFFYMGAQIGTWSFIIRFTMAAIDVAEEQAANYYLASLVVFIVARFACTALMSVMTPGRLLALLSALGVVFCLVAMANNNIVGVYALVAVSASLSLIFPTIFGMASKGLGRDTQLAGAGLVMAILGGAVIPAVQGKISDLQGIQFSFIIPLFCFAAVCLYGLSAEKLRGGATPV